MDPIRQHADLTVRRAAVVGLAAISLVVMALNFDRSLALHALAVLLTAEALVLWLLAWTSARVPFERREVWLILEGGIHPARAQKIISKAMCDAFLSYSRLLAGPAAAAWVVDAGTYLSR